MKDKKYAVRMFAKIAFKSQIKIEKQRNMQLKDKQ